MTGQFEKTLTMPLVVGLKPHSLSLPGTVPLVQQAQAVAGAVKWTAPEWDKAEYEKVQRKVEAVIAESSGMEIEKLIMKIAKAVCEAIPDRTFNVAIGSFGIEYKVKRKK